MSLPTSHPTSRSVSPQPLGAEGGQAQASSLETDTQVSAMLEQATQRMQVLSLEERFIAAVAEPSIDLKAALEWQGKPTPPCFWKEPLAYCCWEYDVIKALVSNGKVIFTGNFAVEKAGLFTRAVPIWQVVENRHTFVCRGGNPVTALVHPIPVERGDDGHFYSHCEAMGWYPISKKDIYDCKARPNPLLKYWSRWGNAKEEAVNCKKQVEKHVEDLRSKLQRLKSHDAEVNNRGRRKLYKLEEKIKISQQELRKIENKEAKAKVKYQEKEAKLKKLESSQP